MHMSECPEKAVQYRVPGCKKMFRRREWDEHMYAYALSHAVQNEGEVQRLREMIHNKVIFRKVI